MYALISTLLFWIHFYVAGHLLKGANNKHLLMPNYNTCLFLTDID